ncbi:MAG: formate/nitrite transporter family protein [Candidatus Cloacimonetes bacterium]|nr:formate/nitrite transporter family protein [Candidatus Cloacimonadota bacterium]
MIYIGYDLLSNAALKKMQFFKKDKLAYFISSMLAGIYVGLCMITILIMAGMLPDFGGIKIIQGASFAAALSLIVFAGAELFTGNVFVMTAGVMKNTVKLFDACKLCLFCYLGNFAGSVVISALFWGTGYLKDAVLIEAVKMINDKTAPIFWELFIRGILCNMLICVGVWCVYRMQSETGKLIMLFWSFYIFVVSGFEHSIANMTLFNLGSFAGEYSGISFLYMLKNIEATSSGNLLGGVILALAYWFLSRHIP